MNRPSSIGLKIRDFFKFEWVSGTGRIVIRALTFGTVHLPKTDPATAEAEFRKRNGFLARLWFVVHWLVIDNIYFIVGFFFWMVFLLIVALIYVAFFGPITPIHQWR